MLHAGILGAFHPSGISVTTTIPIVAKEGTTPKHPFNSIRFIGIKTFGRTFGIDNPFGQITLLIIIGMIKIGAPFPNISGDVI